jgi:hypothetical protein
VARAFRPSPVASVGRRQNGGTVVVSPRDALDEQDDHDNVQGEDEYDDEDLINQLTDPAGQGQEQYIAAVTLPAPAWQATALVNGEFKKISSEDYKGQREQIQ